MKKVISCSIVSMNAFILGPRHRFYALYDIKYESIDWSVNLNIFIVEFHACRCPHTMIWAGHILMFNNSYQYFIELPGGWTLEISPYLPIDIWISYRYAKVKHQTERKYIDSSLSLPPIYYSFMSSGALKNKLKLIARSDGHCCGDSIRNLYGVRSKDKERNREGILLEMARHGL